MSIIVLEDGKISIPKDMQETLGLGPGTILEMQAQGGTLVVRKKIEPDAFDKWRGRGKLPVGGEVDGYFGMIRDGDCG